MLKNVLLAGAAAVALAAVAVPAHADNIVSDQWYTGHFTTTGTPLLGNTFSGTSADLGTNGPTLTNPNPNALQAPVTGAAFSAIITMPSGGGFLTVTDVETPGDQFQINVNGVAATPAPASASPLDVGQQSLAGGLTSAPSAGPDDSPPENIAAALANPEFSSGTFYLPAGTDTITGTFLGTIASGNFDMIAEAPEPASLTILGLGMAGLGLVRRRRRG
jgi:hypothetical protein